jgi:hypothetical protein
MTERHADTEVRILSSVITDGLASHSRDRIEESSPLLLSCPFTVSMSYYR